MDQPAWPDRRTLTFRLIVSGGGGVFAIRAGVKDSREGRAPYGWVILSDPLARGHHLREGWKDVAKVFFVAIVIDFAYQVMELRWSTAGGAACPERFWPCSRIYCSGVQPTESRGIGCVPEDRDDELSCFRGASLAERLTKWPVGPRNPYHNSVSRQDSILSGRVSPTNS